jgi:hypothetical protein
VSHEIPTSLIARTGRIGRFAVGQATRQLATTASTIGRSDARVFEQRSLDAADQIVSVHSSMKGAAMKLGVMMSVIDLCIVPEHARRRRPTEAGCAA